MGRGKQREEWGGVSKGRGGEGKKGKVGRGKQREGWGGVRKGRASGAIC